jgi:hypothetical protein
MNVKPIFKKKGIFFSLLKPFSELSRVYHPIAEIERIKKLYKNAKVTKHIGKVYHSVNL